MKLNLSFFSLVTILFFASCSKPAEEVESEIPQPLPEAALVMKASKNDSTKLTLIGDPVVQANGVVLNQTEGDNGCGKSGGQHIVLPPMDAIWAEGFTVVAKMEFQETRYYERIIDLGNGKGEKGGYNVTFSRLEETNDLAITSWIDTHPTKNRTKGRLVAKNAIRNNEMVTYAATISPTGHMKIFVNGVKVAEKKDGYPVHNVTRTTNFVGHSNWCDEDPDFKGVFGGLKLFNKVLSDAQVATVTF